MVRKLTKFDVVGLYLADYSAGKYLREIAAGLGKPHQTVKPYVEALVKEGILKKTRRKHIVDFHLDMKDPRIFDYLIITEKMRLLERIKSDTLFGILYERLAPFFAHSTFVIFGSAVEKIRKGSDIDLLVIGDADVRKIISEFEKIYNKPVHIVQVKGKLQLQKSFVVEVYTKHLIFNGTEQIIRIFGALHEHRLV